MRTAIGLMGERGYDGTSTRDIAAAADVTVAALYYHFPSKLDLLREFLHEAHDVVLVRLAREIDKAGPDPRSRLDAAVETLIWSNLHTEWAQLAAQVAWREVARLDEPDRVKIVAKRAQMIDLVETVVRDGVTAGVFTTTDAREASRAVFTLCVTIVGPFAEMDLTLGQIIELHQRFAAALACTPSQSPG
ncbi:MAG TPA: TetR/AcrR family transcriptional regulator [Acidimicrobiales bacterium]|jgi:AcrR family transcriptional regulator